jgi:hypothetical protein
MARRTGASARIARRGQAASGPQLVERHFEPELPQNVRTSAPTGNRPVSVLHDGLSAGGGQQRGTRREIQASGAVAASSDHVDCAVGSTSEVGTKAQLPHGRGEAAHLCRGLPLEAQSREEGSRHRVRHRVISQSPEQIGRF